MTTFICTKCGSAPATHKAVHIDIWLDDEESSTCFEHVCLGCGNQMAEADVDVALLPDNP